jgi:hypothetical protein
MTYTSDTIRSHILTACFILALTACSVTAPALTEAQAAALAWQALDARTSSHSLSNWEVLELRRVTGQEITATFAGKPDAGCALGPPAPDNGTIARQDTYWYIQMAPRPATPMPQAAKNFSPTAPPSVPEPFMYQAHFLINLTSGEIVARKLYCVIY